MKIKKIKIADLIEYPNNVRIHTKRNLDTIKKSLSIYGQYKPIIVQESTSYIIAGNGTYQAAKALGWDEIDCNVLNIDNDKARALSIVDNRSGDLSQMDEKNLLDFLKEFDSDLLNLSGYDDSEFEKMLQFQEGTLFEKEKEQPKKPKKKREEAVSSDDQVSFVLMGYPFVMADPDEIKELKNLMDEFMGANIAVRSEATFAVYSALKETIANALNKQIGETESDK